MRTLKFAIAAIGAMIGLGALAQQTLPLQPPVAEEKSAPIAPARTPAAGRADMNAADVNAWLDGFVPYALASGDIAGGVVVIVRDGQILTQRGFGYADVARRTPVDPARTLFRPGSVSKLFTWTAVMQLVEQGRLNLDADVNTYLDFQIPPRDGQPVTLRNIMTHTAGFEEQIKSLLSTSPEAAVDFVELLKRWTPERVFAPGSTPAYSNYATSLAGYIVQRVSGISFYDYVERNIFAPLGMASSSFRQPLPPALAARAATGYRRASGEVVPFEFVGPAPAGSLSSSGVDMGRFMIAHLNNGAFGANRILRPETARMMHTTAAARLGPLSTMLLGFYQTDVNGRRVIAHAGDTVGFHSDLHLFMDDNVGIFVSFNSTGRNGAVGGLRQAIFEEFADRYFPARRNLQPIDAATSAEHAQMVAGTYTASRGAFSSFMNVLELLGQATVAVNGEGQLVAPGLTGLSGEPRNWVEIAPFVWQDVNSHQRLAALVENGQVTRFSFDQIAPFTVFDRTPWHRNSAWLLPALLASLAILLLTAIFWPVRALVRRRFAGTLPLERRELLAYRGTRIASWLIVLAVLGWATVISIMMGDFNNLSPGFDPIIYFLQVFTFIAFIGGLAVIVWHLWLTWRKKSGWKAKLWSLALLFAGVIVVWVGLAFNLLSFGANY